MRTISDTSMPTKGRESGTEVVVVFFKRAEQLFVAINLFIVKAHQL